MRRNTIQRASVANVVPSSPILVTLMMEALSSSETSVLTRATRRNIPEDAILLNISYLTILTEFRAELNPWIRALHYPPAADGQQFPSILWNMEVHHGIHKSQSLVPILSQITLSLVTSSEMLSVYVHPLMSETKFHIQTRPQAKL
jgi:hypothetical protein